ncbi:MAG TPA: hypothetical protein VEB22_14615 [Phycisphaerales bacterium]|nr:hypothetical protein [Phycisphaerales bacterium]
MRLWPALESGPLARGWSGVRATWREQLGDEWRCVEPLLCALEQLALSVRLGDAPEPLRVVHHSDNDIVAVDMEAGVSVPLRREEVVIYRLDKAVLLQAVAKAFGLTGALVPVANNRPWWLGEFVLAGGERFPFYFAEGRNAGTLVGDVGIIAALTPRPFVLVTVSRDAASEQLDLLLGGRGAAWISLEEVLQWRSEGALTAKRPLAAILASFVSAHAGPSMEAAAAQFPTPRGASWSDVTIRVVDGHSLWVNVKGTVREVGYAEMGMRDGRTRNPDKQWELLLLLIARGGLLRRQDPAASATLQKRKETLAKRLRAYFGIEDEPVELVDGADWRCRFEVEAVGHER